MGIFLGLCVAMQGSPTAAGELPKKQSFYLNQGEHLELKIQGLKKFSVTTPEVLGHKYLEKKEAMLLKGKEEGFSELIVWKFGNQPKKRVFRVHVLPQKNSLKRLHLAKSFRELGLNVQSFDAFLVVEGKLEDFQEYRLAHQVKKRFPEMIKLHLTLTPELAQ